MDDPRGPLPDRKAMAEQTTEAQVLAYAPGPDEETLRIRRKKRKCMAAVFLAAVLGGAVVGATSSDPTALQLAVNVIFDICAVVWIAIDANSRHRQVGNGMRVLAFFIPPLGIVAYYLLLKDWWGLGRAVAFMAGAFVAMMASAAVSGVVAALV